MAILSLAVHACDQGDLMAFMIWAPIYMRNGWTGDYIRRIKDSPNEVIDYLIVSTLLELQKKGLFDSEYG